MILNEFKKELEEAGYSEEKIKDMMEMISPEDLI